MFAAKPTGFGTQTTGLFGQQSCAGSTGFSFTQTQPQSTFGTSLFGAKTSASTGFGGFGAAGTTGFSTCDIYFMLAYVEFTSVRRWFLNKLQRVGVSQHDMCTTTTQQLLDVC